MVPYVVNGLFGQALLVQTFNAYQRRISQIPVDQLGHPFFGNGHDIIQTLLRSFLMQLWWGQRSQPQQALAHPVSRLMLGNPVLHEAADMGIKRMIHRSPSSKLVLNTSYLFALQ
jgi:hypothetical protein